MKLNTIKYNKEYQLTHNSKEVARIIKPKWYSSDIQCYLKNKTFLIKKVNFWGTYYNIIEMGDSIGEIKWSFKCGYILTLKNSDGKTIEYKLKKVSSGKWNTSQKQYILQENDHKIKVILTINYKITFKWKSYENIEIFFSDDSQIDYLKTICSLFLMRKQISLENSSVYHN